MLKDIIQRLEGREPWDDRYQDTNFYRLAPWEYVQLLQSLKDSKEIVDKAREYVNLANIETGKSPCDEGGATIDEWIEAVRDSQRAFRDLQRLLEKV